MTKEELEKEAEDYAEQCYGWTNNDLALDVAKATYITSAEPREKRVEELEKACEETQELLDKQIEATYRLDKENAELKEQHEVSARNMSGFIESLSKSENEVKKQLTKAKDHIKKLLGCLQQDTNDPQTNYYVVKYMTEAEQFLK